MNTGVDCHFLLQGTFPTKELNSGLLYGGQILYQLSLIHLKILCKCQLSQTWAAAAASPSPPVDI